MKFRQFLLASLAATLLSGAAYAADTAVKIGVLNDTSGE